MVSANHSQLLIPDEARAIRKSMMRVVHHEQDDGIWGWNAPQVDCSRQASATSRCSRRKPHIKAVASGPAGSV